MPPIELEEMDDKEYNKLSNIEHYVLNDKDRFFNWVYPTYEETSYKYIQGKWPDRGLEEESQGQLFTKQFLVDSPYRGILLYHGLGTGKTCASLITSERINFPEINKHVFVFLPATLRQTWLDELVFCGNPSYADKTFIYRKF